jgi:hypothetical protein
MTVGENRILVENAHNYITFNVKGDAELVGMDNGEVILQIRTNINQKMEKLIQEDFFLID